MARREMSEIERAEIAAVMGTADAFYDLGIMYSNDRDMEVDLVSAHKWFNLAALKGHKQALKLRTEIAMDMSDCDIAQAQRSAREWMMTH